MRRKTGIYKPFQGFMGRPRIVGVIVFVIIINNEINISEYFTRRWKVHSSSKKVS
jgi:hypothetical protein